MLFNSYAFFVFLGTVLIIHFSLPQRWRNVFLLVASSGGGSSDCCWPPKP